ncbi:unnamed protein product [Rotaria sordida]|uniref:Uncharacterized protein n=1 Tax=Rotaria sordida TaxID=392033 RepID=A0A815KD72_9BILA|nr:unnamed protein product [Rotaria sordida]CAF1391754.1 unnamed protein product [Rotaria sordida]CAF1509819.1 unnamed protein product [Rotaria sordida]CAF1620580.1 unnamed protein product [Rotaria sordida]CAF3960590.1 unnamed protein product [Rotaria sordida]
MAECLESLKKECAQHHIERCASFDNAFHYIEQLSANTIAILVVVGHLYQNLKDELSRIDFLPRAIRNCFVYSTEYEHTEKPMTSSTQYVFGQRQLLSSIRDVLDALDVSPVHEHSGQYISITVHQSTFNELFRAMKSIQVKLIGFTIKVSQMETVLSPSMFQFKAFAEVFGPMERLPRITKQTVHGECELILDENTGKLMLKIKKLRVELPKLFGYGGGSADISTYMPYIPLDGFINFSHPFKLPDLCETKRLEIIPRHPKFIVEEKRVTISVEIHYAEASSDHK